MESSLVFIMTIIISLLLLVSLLPNPTFTADVGIVNGREAKPHSRPYMVSLQENGYHVCDGFLISDRFVLTAAHCKRKNYEILTVVVGAHDLTDKNLQHIEVMSYIPHPDFNDYYENDIMLLELKKKISLNKKNLIGLISLPYNGEEKVVCSVAGWGSLWTHGPTYDRLIEANTNILNDHLCESKLKSRYNASQRICAYGSGGFCNWDAGAPLVCGNKPTAVGIASFHNYCLCNSHEEPDVYTRISSYLSWIRKVIGNWFHAK